MQIYDPYDDDDDYGPTPWVTIIAATVIVLLSVGLFAAIVTEVVKWLIV